MKSVIKQQLINDVLTGLLVAATFAMVAPTHVMADTFSGAADLTSTQLFKPAVTVLSYGCYAAGAFFGIQGIAHVKKHTDSPSQNALGPALGKLGVGAGLIAIPSVINLLQDTGTSVVGGGDASAKAIGF
jgi:hypothetical protein